VIENNVIADDGQIIVLGGLIEDTEGDGTDKVRGLGDIPCWATCSSTRRARARRPT
jgi:type II secretory pathway component GspD/PulD (secretin)